MREVSEKEGVNVPARDVIVGHSEMVHVRIHLVLGPNQIEEVKCSVKSNNGESEVTLRQSTDNTFDCSINLIVEIPFWSEFEQ